MKASQAVAQTRVYRLGGRNATENATKSRLGNRCWRTFIARTCSSPEQVSGSFYSGRSIFKAGVEGRHGFHDRTVLRMS